MASAPDDSLQSSVGPDVQLVVDAIPGLGWSGRPDGSVEIFNGRWLDYTGLSLEESSGRGWQASVHAEDLVRLTELLIAHDAGDGQGCEVRLRHAEGGYQWFLVRQELLVDPSGTVARWYGTWINIEETKQKELLGVAGRRALEMIADGASLSEVLSELCSVIDVYTSATSQVLLIDRAAQRLLPLAGPHFPAAVTAALAPWPVGPNAGCCGTAAFTGERVIISDLSTDPRWPQDKKGKAALRLVMEHGLRAAWSEPLISNSEIIGTFCIGYP
jgi:PAS domain S-box-containing protein